MKELFKNPILYYFSLHKRKTFFGICALFLTNVVDTILPFLIGIGIDQIANGDEWTNVGQTALCIIGATIVLSFFRYLWRIHWGRFHHTVASDLKNKLFDKFLKLGPTFYAKNPVGQLMSLISNDVNSFRMAVGPGVLIILDALFLLLLIPPVMLSISVDWTWKTLILMPVIPFLIYKVIQLIHHYYKLQQDRFSEVSGVAQEIISGIRVIKSYAQEKNQTRFFNRGSKKYEDACNDVARVDAYFTPSMEFGIASGSVILLLVGAPEVVGGAITIGSFFTFYQYIQRMIWPMTAIGLGFSFIQKGLASFSRIEDVLNAEEEVSDSGQADIDQFLSLEFKNLNFSYPEDNNKKATLKNISFRLEAGESMGIIGQTGSGKSTLVDLMTRLYSAPKNTIFINEIPIEQISLDSLRRLISYVPQDAFLFSKPIHENVAFGLNHWEFQQVKDVTRLVNIHEEIMKTPEKYETYLGERGVNLSGGQKQRLTIARALIRKTPIMILDDSLSAVDANTEKNILHNLTDQLNRNEANTTIIVSHRIDSIKWVDKILVLKDGQIEAYGNHSELENQSPTYLKIYNYQHGGSQDV